MFQEVTPPWYFMNARIPAQFHCPKQSRLSHSDEDKLITCFSLWLFPFICFKTCWGLEMRLLPLSAVVTWYCFPHSRALNHHLRRKSKNRNNVKRCWMSDLFTKLSSWGFSRIFIEFFCCHSLSVTRKHSGTISTEVRCGVEFMNRPTLPYDTYTHGLIDGDDKMSAFNSDVLEVFLTQVWLNLCQCSRTNFKSY